MSDLIWSSVSHPAGVRGDRLTDRAVAGALLTLMMFGGLSLYVGHWTKSHLSTASSSGFSYLHVLIFALAAASQVTHGLGAPSFVFVGLVVVMGVVAVVDQLVRHGERRRVQEESASDLS